MRAGLVGDPMNQAPKPEKTPASLAARVGLWLGPVWLLLTLLLPAPGGMPQPAWSWVGLTLLMATWWTTETIPIHYAVSGCAAAGSMAVTALRRLVKHEARTRRNCKAIRSGRTRATGG
jgi:hypothetical protein